MALGMGREFRSPCVFGVMAKLRLLKNENLFQVWI